MIARQVLERLFADLGFEGFDCESEFRAIWADMADVISVQYSGTRERQNSWWRYYVNNVRDDRRQGAYDAVTQTVTCDRYISPRSTCFVLLAILWVTLVYWITRLFRGKVVAERGLEAATASAVESPQFRGAEIRKLA
jgi:hypothetical protein